MSDIKHDLVNRMAKAAQEVSEDNADFNKILNYFTNLLEAPTFVLCKKSKKLLFKGEYVACLSWCYDEIKTSVPLTPQEQEILMKENFLLVKREDLGDTGKILFGESMDDT